MNGTPGASFGLPSRFTITSVPPAVGPCVGQTRVIDVRDQNLKVTKVANRKVDGEHQVGAPLQGRIAEVKVNVGDTVKENQALFVVEAMKMETTVSAPEAGKVKAIYLKGGDMVEQDDLVVELE